jgi:hypothetical protein
MSTPAMSIAVTERTSEPDLMPRWLTGLARVSVWFVLAVLSLWAIAALYIDIRLPKVRMPLTILYVVILVAIMT